MALIRCAIGYWVVVVEIGRRRRRHPHRVRRRAVATADGRMAARIAVQAMVPCAGMRVVGGDRRFSGLLI